MNETVIILAPQFEEVEAITPIDFLRRAGIRVTIAGLTERTITSARGVSLLTDVTLEEIENQYFDAVILPGGRGAWTIAESDRACNFILKHYQKNKLLAAICAAPAIILGKTLKILGNKNFTCYPGLEREAGCGNYNKMQVVQDGNCITAQGPGSAAQFALAIIKALAGNEKALEIANATLLTIDF